MNLFDITLLVFYFLNSSAIYCTGVYGLRLRKRPSFIAALLFPFQFIGLFYELYTTKKDRCKK
jgi:hypothetical protein